MRILFVIIILFLFGCCVDYRMQRTKADKEERAYEVHNLVSLKTNNDKEGQFFLGSGYVNNTLYYHFFYETDKGIKYDYIRASHSNVYIVETDSTPRITKYGLYLTDTTTYYYTDRIQEVSRLVFYIPHGSLKSNFNINEDE